MKGEVILAKKTMSMVSVAFFLLTMCLQPVCAQQVLSDSKKKVVDSTAEKTEKPPEEFVAEKPKTEESATTKKWLMYGGAAALVVGVAAVAAGGGGGSSAPACEETTIGPHVAGSGWSGTLALAANGSQAVTATVTQCGNRVLIVTNSGLKYGQSFEGTMQANGHMLVYDGVTGEDWTTHFGPSSSTAIMLYDYVNLGSEMDKLELYRTLAPAE